MEDVPNLINICATNPIKVLNLHEFFEDFVCALEMIVWTKNDVGTGAPQQRREVY